MRPMSWVKKTIHTRSLYQPLWDAYEPHILVKDRICLHQLEKDWAQRQPLRDKRVLINVHLTRITLALVTALLRSGAHVEVTVSPELVTHQNALQAVLAARIPFLPVIPAEKKRGYYDIVYDCGAGMKDIIPNVGMVELTHTPPSIYRTLSFPVISVDQSKTKAIETGLGTGDSFVRVMHDLARQAIATLALNWSSGLNQSLPHQRWYLTMLLSLLHIHPLFSRNRFMIFGFGKVGKGIASALESAGTPKKNIMVIDVSLEAYMDAMKQGYSGLFLNSRIVGSVEKIKKVLPQMWVVVTATGVEGTLSHYFSQSDFNPATWLVNMSTGDDFGVRFTEDRILNRKKPANFMLDYPTEVMYLDAIFTLFLKAGEELLINPTLKPGLNPIAAAVDQAVLADWIAQQGDSIWRHQLGQAKTETLIQYLRQNSTSPHSELSRWIELQGIFQQPVPSKQTSLSQLTLGC